MNNKTWILIIILTLAAYCNLFAVELNSCNNSLKRITVALTSFPDPPLNNALIYVNGQQIYMPVYDTIFHTDSNYRITSRILKTWFSSPDHKRYTFILKDGITFTDGKPLTAETIMKILDPRSKSKYASPSIKKIIKSVKISGNNCVIILLKKPYMMLPEMLSDFQTIVVHQDDSLKDWPEGSGPFKICYSSADEIVLERRVIRNQNAESSENQIEQIRYIVPHKFPITWRWIKEEKVDFFPFVAIDSRESANRSFVSQRILSQRVRAVIFNIKDIKVRKALATCLDRDKLFSHPSLKEGAYKYDYMLTMGIENFSGNKKILYRCEPYNGTPPTKPITYLSHHDDDGAHEFMKGFIYDWSKNANLPIDINIININDTPKKLSSKDYSIAFIGIGPKSPLADGLFREFAAGGTQRSIIDFSVKEIDDAYNEYTVADPLTSLDAINNVEFLIRKLLLAVPIAIQSMTFYIPKSWGKYTLTASSTGVFDLTNLTIRK